MANVIIENVITSIFTEVFKAGFKDATEWFKGKSREHDFLGKATKRYADKLEERYNTIRIFGMDRPVPLRHIYVRVNILEKITATQRVSLEDLIKHLDPKQG